MRFFLLVLIASLCLFGEEKKEKDNLKQHIERLKVAEKNFYIVKITIDSKTYLLGNVKVKKHNVLESSKVVVEKKEYKLENSRHGFDIQKIDSVTVIEKVLKPEKSPIIFK